MRIRVGKTRVITRVYWDRIGAVALACMGCAWLVGGPQDKRDYVAEYRAPVIDDQVAVNWPIAPVDELEESYQTPAGYLVSSSSGVRYTDWKGETKQVWSGATYDTLCVDGTLVVSDRYADRVVIVRDGEALTSIPAQGPVDCEVSDTALVVMQNGSDEVVAYDPETHDVLWRVGGFSNPYDVELLPNGGFLVADSGNGRVVEFNADHELVVEYANLGFPSSVEVLDNGNLQVTTYTAGEVLELERGTGALVRKMKVDGTVFRAMRQPDGTTVVYEGSHGGGQGRLHVFDTNGRLLQVSPLPGGVDCEPGDL